MIVIIDDWPINRLLGAVNRPLRSHLVDCLQSVYTAYPYEEEWL